MQRDVLTGGTFGVAAGADPISADGRVTHSGEFSPRRMPEHELLLAILAEIRALRADIARLNRASLAPRGTTG